MSSTADQGNERIGASGNDASRLNPLFSTADQGNERISASFRRDASRL